MHFDAASLVAGAVAGPARAQIIEQVLVKVNGDIFTQDRTRGAADRGDPRQSCGSRSEAGHGEQQ